MPVFIFLGLLFLATPALAMSESIVNYCFTTQNPKSCIDGYLADERAYTASLQQQQLNAQLEQARLQANGMALFGAGFALIQGMNQNLQHIQQPYVNTPYFTHTLSP